MTVTASIVGRAFVSAIALATAECPTCRGKMSGVNPDLQPNLVTRLSELDQSSFS